MFFKFDNHSETLRGNEYKKAVREGRYYLGRHGNNNWYLYQGDKQISGPHKHARDAFVKYDD